ncbi:MAG: hypothetical protein KDG50_15400 [Chromatiales bacterium]|nr:hypothetical protein [Chromatiales bacterium]
MIASVLSLAAAGVAYGDDDLRIRSAQWRADEARLSVRVRAEEGDRLTVVNAADHDQVLGSRRLRDEEWTLRVSDPSPVPCRVRVERSGGGSVERDVENAPSNCGPTAGGGSSGSSGGGSSSSSSSSGGSSGSGSSSSSGGSSTSSGGSSSSSSSGGGTGTFPPPPDGPLRVLGANDLGMHCTDKDFQIFSILPPFNSVHAQVIERGSSSALPRIVTGAEIDVYYTATTNPLDPVGMGSINTTGANAPPDVFKTNFWDVAGGSTLGGLAYRSLYPGQDKLGLCDPTAGPCPSVLDLFEPIALDLGLPVPDPVELPALAPSQQAHVSAISHDPFTTDPYNANVPQVFDRFDANLPFFAGFPFGAVLSDVNWFAADGIPLLPVDDSGRENAYPMMRIDAVAKGVDASSTGASLASLDIVLPVASEADCQNCHADTADAGNGAATNFASTSFVIARVSDAPGPEPLQNAAKLNILRLHDAKNGAAYTSSVDGAPTPCNTGAEPSCLANRTPVQCSQCHYSPALDLAQVGPVDEPEQGEGGRQQTRHISMSRAMHGHHGQFGDLFPEMPPPNDPQRMENGLTAINDFVESVLEETCYQCHPGKRTQCLRGAMFAGGLVCQDCHGNMQQVGDDFTGGFPLLAGADLTKRVPWAHEPKCQSCHTGDAMSNLVGTPHTIAAADGIRLAQAFLSNDLAATPIEAAASRFAENASLYRLSSGHGGVMCEGCHGSTHAIWPVNGPNGAAVGSLANDNVAALDLQGHTGTLIECTTCHEPTSTGLPLNLKGPHGMHPIADFNGPDQRWNDKHKEVLEKQGPAACQGCHGQNGEGTVLSRTATNRRLECKEKSGSLCGSGAKYIDVPKGTQIGCAQCHENELFHD